MDTERANEPNEIDVTGFRERVENCPRLGRRLWEALRALDRVTYRPELEEVARRERLR